MTAVCVLFAATAVSAEAQTDIAFWNLENFFDYFDDGGSSSDSDFSSRGKKRWTKARFVGKCNLVGKALLWMGENCCRDGKPPEIVGVAEVENGFVLNRLVNSPVLRKLDYAYVHFDSPDRRGIDVALLYRRSAVRLLSSRAVHIRSDNGGIMRTRDILYVKVTCSGICGDLDNSGVSDNTADTLHLLVNHHPSKFSGEKASMHGRELAMIALRDVCDSIARVSDAPIVAMGDFNDAPDGAQFALLEGRLKNLAEPLAERGEGSIRYGGRWELIDHFLVGGGRRPVARAEASCTDVVCAEAARADASRAEASDGGVGKHCDGGGIEMRVVQVPFLMARDRAHTGFKPLRTYSGPRWIGGVSDHCPILLRPIRGHL